MNTQDLSRRLGVASRFEANELKDLLSEAADTIDAQAAEIARLQAISLQPAHDAVTIDCLNDKVMLQREAMREALEALQMMKSYGNVFLHRGINPYEKTCQAIQKLEGAL